MTLPINPNPNLFRHAAPAGGNWVWQDHAMGGGRWVPQPQAGRLSDEDVERIASAVVRRIKADRSHQ